MSADGKVLVLGAGIAAGRRRAGGQLEGAGA